MKQFLVKLVWAWRILKARHFIVLTNKASMLFIPRSVVKEPHFADLISLTSQRALLTEYRAALDDVIKDFDEEMKHRSRKSNPSKRTNKVTK